MHVLKLREYTPKCIFVELYKHAGIFKNTREVPGEARGVTECFSHACLYMYIHVCSMLNIQLNNARGASLLFPKKMLNHGIVCTQTCDVGRVHYNSIKHAHDQSERRLHV